MFKSFNTIVFYREFLWSHIRAEYVVVDIQDDAGSSQAVKGFSNVKLLKISDVHFAKGKHMSHRGKRVICS